MKNFISEINLALSKQIQAFEKMFGSLEKFINSSYDLKLNQMQLEKLYFDFHTDSTLAHIMKESEEIFFLEPDLEMLKNYEKELDGAN